MADSNAESVKHENNTQWKPGQSGNPNGRPKKGQTLTDLMRDYLDGAEADHPLPRKQEFIRKVAKLAYDGDMTAIKLMWNYLDGMPVQKIEVDKPSLLVDTPTDDTEIQPTS